MPHNVSIVSCFLKEIDVSHFTKQKRNALLKKRAKKNLDRFLIVDRKLKLLSNYDLYEALADAVGESPVEVAKMNNPSPQKVQSLDKLFDKLHMIGIELETIEKRRLTLQRRCEKLITREHGERAVSKPLVNGA